MQMLTSLLLSALAATSAAYPSPRSSTTKWSQLEIQPHSRHLARTTTGEPFFWQADTAWELAARLNASDVDTYLADRASKGFNVIQVVALPELNGTTHPNYYGDLPLVDEDPMQPVEEYFQYLDYVIDRAADYGILTALVPTWGRWVNCGWRGEPILFNEKNARAFGQYIGNRYPGLPKMIGGDSNGDWACSIPDISEEYTSNPNQDPYAMLPNITDTRYIWSAMVSGMQEAEKAHDTDLFVTFHPTNTYLNLTGLPLAYGHNYLNTTTSPFNVSMDVVQSGHAIPGVTPSNEAIVGWDSEKNYDMVTEMRDAFIGPVIDLENHYEGAHISFKKEQPLWNSSEVRHGLWNGFFAGAAGVTYGAHSIWQFYDPVSLLDNANSFIEPQNDLARNASWRYDLHLKGAEQVQHLKNLFETLGKDTYFAIAPDNAIIDQRARAYENNRHVSALSSGGRYWVYTGYGDSFTLTLPINESTLTAKWYNPRTGEYGEDMPRDSDSLTFTPPSSGTVDDDWVFCVQIN
ncbi:hypothetical protein E3P99_01837 [Wallemia hederae]|uniref:DUF4038 domain-containing protein n=1 Tax=Wallemia hederae TaxID=1540922 RepID=A0A4T0FMT2_9BASI|nr:hypothetical protein E3P99_01837 [Wallemia hederae]